MITARIKREEGLVVASKCGNGYVKTRVEVVQAKP
jgi:hypothetical protein